MTDQTATETPPVTPADVLAAGLITWPGAVLDTAAAATLTAAFEECPGQPGAGPALRVLASYYTDQIMPAIRDAQAAGDIPADVLAWPVPALDVIDFMANSGMPAPDSPATEALVEEVTDLILRRLCAERAGLCAGGLNRILRALHEAGAGSGWGTPAESEAIGRLADRIAELAGDTVAGPGGIGFTVS